ncbi:hypothetical protein OAG47_02340, partial [Verrucomicrobiales bacterium]|nr:hypothetical protein [Verrucomicrobiales bacterium]
MPANQLRSNDQSVWFIASLVYVSVCSYIFIAALPEYSDSNRFYACTLFVFCTFPLIRHIVRDDATVPILEIPLASYAVYYCLPLLYQSEHAVYATTIVPSPKHIDRTLIGVILGVVGMISGYVAAKSFNLLSIIPKITVPEFRSGPLARVALSIIAASFLFQLLIGSAPAGTERIVAVLLSQDVAIALLGILYYTNCLSKGYTALAICLLIALTFKGLVSGSTQTALQPLFVWALTGWITRKQFPYKMALLGIVAALITQPVKKQYRQQVWFGKSSQSTAIERFELYVKIGLDHWVRN